MFSAIFKPLHNHARLHFISSHFSVLKIHKNYVFLFSCFNFYAFCWSINKMNFKFFLPKIQNLYNNTAELSLKMNFKYLLESAAVVRQVKSIYPTLTYPCHATMATGCFPSIPLNLIGSLEQVKSSIHLKA